MTDVTGTYAIDDLSQGGGPEHVRPVVLPFTRETSDLTDPTFMWLLRAAQLLVGALAFVVAVNLAILLYARTVTRLGEIAVRTALGASRRASCRNCSSRP